MDELNLLLQENLNSSFLSAVLSNPRDKALASKIKVRPILKKEALLFQIELFRNNQAFHENLDASTAASRLAEHMHNMRQMELETTGYCYTVLISKKGKVTIKKHRQSLSGKTPAFSHNRKKKYILEEGIPIPFLKDLGVMTDDGRIIHAKFDKFRQINRFLEFIEDILPQLPKNRELTILDFGCGKSYLTFAIYYYLNVLKGYNARIIGLDLKSQVIRSCNELSSRYGYEKLTFMEGDIANYTGTEKVDMVVTLHACDTATDFALAKAIGWKAKVILSVPCCQHELNRQIKNELLTPLLKHGIIKERLAALVTDALRAEYLEQAGYHVQLLEFIAMEHTPKNLLIRAVRTEKKADNIQHIQACEEFLHVSPTLGALLESQGDF